MSIEFLQCKSYGDVKGKKEKRKIKKQNDHVQYLVVGQKSGLPSDGTFGSSFPASRVDSSVSFVAKGERTAVKRDSHD